MAAVVKGKQSAMSVESSSEDSNSGPIIPKSFESGESSSGCVKRHSLVVKLGKFNKTLIKPWKTEIYDLFVHKMKVDARFHFKKDYIELKTMPMHPNITNLKKCRTYLEAVMIGFKPDRMRNAFLNSKEFFQYNFDIMSTLLVVDPTFDMDNLLQAIKGFEETGSKTISLLENRTNTSILQTSSYVDILGSYDGVLTAKDCLCTFVLARALRL
ncbi:unnamed protein product [Amaranthus hypochondriacus]